MAIPEINYSPVLVTNFNLAYTSIMCGLSKPNVPWIMGQLENLDTLGVALLGVADNDVILGIMEAQNNVGLITNNIVGAMSASDVSDSKKYPRFTRLISSIAYNASTTLQILNFFHWERCILINSDQEIQ